MPHKKNEKKIKLIYENIEVGDEFVLKYLKKQKNSSERKNRPSNAHHEKPSRKEFFLKEPQPLHKNIKKVCLTGGPCGGKTSAIKMIKERLWGKNTKFWQL